MGTLLELEMMGAWIQNDLFFGAHIERQRFQKEFIQILYFGPDF